MKSQHSNKPYHKNVNPNHPGFKIRPPHDVFPEDIQCVFQAENGKGAIYLGNLEAAQSLETLKKLKIKSLLTSCKNIYIRHPKEHVPYSLYIPGEDHENYDLSVHFETAINFIHQSRKETSILIHCMAGISRSATLVMAYLIKYYKMPFSQAISLLRQKRNKVNPNPGFVKQLKKWQQKHLFDRNASRKSQQKPQHYKYDHVDYSKTKYDSVYTTSKKPLPHSNTENYQYTYLADNYKPNKPYQTIQNAYQKKYNPENEYTYSKNSKPDTNSHYKSSHYNTIDTKLNGANRIPFQSRVKEALGNITNSKVCLTTNPYKERSVDTLGKDLDDRIAKIKQKYYEASSSLGIDKMEANYGPDYMKSRHHNRSYQESRRLNSTYEKPFDQRKAYNNYMGGNSVLERSRASRQSLRSSVYGGSFIGDRTRTYQYG